MGFFMKHVEQLHNVHRQYKRGKYKRNDKCKPGPVRPNGKQQGSGRYEKDDPVQTR